MVDRNIIGNITRRGSQQINEQNKCIESGQLLKPHQCGNCGIQYEGENYDFRHHINNYNHYNIHDDDLPTTVKKYYKSNKNLEQQKMNDGNNFMITHKHFID